MNFVYKKMNFILYTTACHVTMVIELKLVNFHFRFVRSYMLAY